MTELKCDNCGNTALILLSSKIQGMDRVIDIYFCKKCQHGKTVSTLKDSKVEDIETIDVPIPDIDEPDFEELEEPQNPYEDDDGGWDPSIG